MRFTREEYLDLMTFAAAPRPMFVELFGPLIGLEEEWLAQGASAGEIAMTAFDWDYVEVVRCGANAGLCGAPPSVVLEETDDYRLERDGLGRRVQLFKKSATIGLPLDFPVTDMNDWLKLKPLFEFREERIDWNAVALAKAAQQRGAVVVGVIAGGFDVARELMGEENACLAYYEQPELMHDIVQTISDTAFAIYSRLAPKLMLDQLSVHEDMAGKSGPLAGPAQIREFIGPYYRRIWDVVHAGGTKMFELDSDGNIEAILEPMMQSGLTAIHPIEPAAGMDMVKLRQQYGKRLGLRGGIDKHVLRQDKAAIRKELEYKLQPLMRQGGTVFGLDHRIPNGTPLANYRYYVATGREILGLPPVDGKSQGWRRMAF